MSKIRPFPGPMQKKRSNGGSKYVLTAEQEQWLRDYFPTHRGDMLRAMMGVSLSTFYRLLKCCGVEKTDAQRARIFRRNAKIGRQTCEANGYYDSIRGKRPSQQCIDGSRAMWQRIHSGEALHPLQKIKKDNPRRYKRLCEERSRKRKMVFKIERLRLMSGLKQETKLNVCAQPFTRSQTCHRNNALKRGYYYYVTRGEQSPERWNIYFDKDTIRSPRFEANLKADGFHVVEGTN